ncbi:MAG: hypothetical protein KGJ55_11050 [Gammaproteobacteria bacterium]|nr:hypothetical protein [Gammaproteobacteria bacterium]
MKLVYDDGDLRVQGLDRSAKPLVTLRFLSDVLLIRIVDEGVRLRLLREMPPMRALLLVDQQSELVRWVFDEGLETRDMRDVRHFMIFIGQEIVDVIAFDDPKITMHHV